MEIFQKFRAIGQLSELKELCFDLQMKEGIQRKIKSLFLNVDFDLLRKNIARPKPQDIEIILEISESEAVQDVEDHLEVAKKWRAQGYKFAMDDFGAGFISLPFISRLVPEYIKLDRTTILQAASSDQFKAMLKDLLTGLRKCSTEGIIAEGIETESELAVVEGLGVHLVQGYLFGKPKKLS